MVDHFSPADEDRYCSVVDPELAAALSADEADPNLAEQPEDGDPESLAGAVALDDDGVAEAGRAYDAERAAGQ